MTFEQKSKQYFVLSGGLLAMWAIEFKIIADTLPDSRSIIDQFIKAPQDMVFARKYVGGYPHDHTDQFGKRTIFSTYNFGPYPVNALAVDDYIEMPIGNFEQLAFQMLADFTDEIKNSGAHATFSAKVKKEFHRLKKHDADFFQLLPAISKLDELSHFTLDRYLCGFCVNRENKTLTVLQFDND